MISLVLHALLLAGPDAPAVPPAPPPAPTEKPEDHPYEFEIEGDTILGDMSQRDRITGSATVIGEEQLEAYEYDDIHRVLVQVPGVYVRGEDGFGLRPNIGIRGANPDRSAKITLLEDGVLMGPAPYSAPAAYYFPLVTRMTGVEVFKGPAAISHGPSTIGGAINLTTRAVPDHLVLGGDFALGLDNAIKAHGYTGFGNAFTGILLEAAHIRSDGFKRLASGASTGFEKTELMAKARFNTAPTAQVFQQLLLKAGWANEGSNETYLGLTDEDFAEDHLQRYPASALGRMDWERWQAVASYLLRVGDGFELRLDAYRHAFSRGWRKLNGFTDGTAVSNVLADPNGVGAIYADILRGVRDTQDDGPGLLIGTNQRDFISYGLQLNGRFDLPSFWLVHQSLKFGARFHQDTITRLHTEIPHAMQDGVLSQRGDKQIALSNRGASTAWALHLTDEITIEDLLITPGLRIEIIQNQLSEKSGSATVLMKSGSDTVLMPGIGASYRVTEWLTVLAGVYRGFSAVAPGQPDSVVSESSINSEGGARVKWEDLHAEAIGFFNAYSNLNGDCTFSAGCNNSTIGQQFNAGAANIYGLETTLGYTWKAPWDFTVGGYVSYTLTLSEFQTDFISTFPQFGSVQTGDRLPYVPEHQAAIVARASALNFTLDVSVAYMGAMLDEAGQGELPERLIIPDHAVVDISASYAFLDYHRVYVNVYNAFDNRTLASRRPFGARPGRPVHFQFGYQFSYDDEEPSS